MFETLCDLVALPSPTVRAPHVAAVFGALTPSHVRLVGTFREIALVLEHASLQRLVVATLVLLTERIRRPCTQCHWMPHDEHIELLWPSSVREVHLGQAQGEFVNCHGIQLDPRRAVRKMSIDHWNHTAIFSSKNDLSHIEELIVRVPPSCQRDWFMYEACTLRQYPKLHVVFL
jgi:hypothetical protein